MSDRPTGPRCAALVGPYLSGKTTLLEAILFASGTINRHGNQKDGNTVGDSTPESRGRQMSTEINVARATYLDDIWTFLDCPGSVELAWEGQNAILASDVAVVVCEPEIERALTLGPLFKFLDDHQIPHMVFINKMDTASARVSEVLAALQGVSQRPLVLRQVPMESDDHPNGYVDLVSERAYKYKPGAASDLIKLPEEMANEEKTGRAGLVEKLADFDDKLLEQLLEDVQPSKEDIYRHLTQNLRRDLIVPVFMGAAAHDSGVRRLLKALRHETPDVAETAARLKLDPKASDTIANVIKTYHPPNAGKLSLARVWSGHVTEGMSLNGVRVAGVLRLLGAQSTKVSSAGPGEVVALARLEGIATGTVLSSGSSPPAFPTLPIPHPVYGLAIAAQNRNDDVKLSGALHRLIEEDPTLSIEHNAELQEQILCGQGDIHLQVALDRLKHRFNLGTLARKPQVPYKESIKAPTALHSRFKRQSGGHGQFADIQIEVKPLPRGTGFNFKDAVVGGAIPRNYIPAVEEGVIDYLKRGPLGFPVVDVAVTLITGQFHDVDSSDQAFKTVARQAMSEAMPKCNPVLLEPIGHVSISVPNAFTSRVQRIVSGRRGQILGFDGKEGWDGWDQVEAHMPMSELHDLIVELRSVTLGVGTYDAKFDHLQELQGKLAEKVLQTRAGEAAQ
ncbi:MAG TPA: elongation factor G [Stellaceae bacterium]|jgi:elongation factor G|nr:elongation factor G [Stellaceae bacterium]